VAANWRIFDFVLFLFGCCCCYSHLTCQHNTQLLSCAEIWLWSAIVSLIAISWALAIVAWSTTTKQRQQTQQKIAVRAWRILSSLASNWHWALSFGSEFLMLTQSATKLLSKFLSKPKPNEMRASVFAFESACVN